ncbi:MAG: OadG family protein [Cellvibrionaceae bacterium]
MTTSWSNSIELMLLGMGTVFVFLTLLVISVTIMSAVLRRIADEEPAPAASHNIGSPDTEIAAVAAIAYSAANAK